MKSLEPVKSQPPKKQRPKLSPRRPQKKFNPPIRSSPIRNSKFGKVESKFKQEKEMPVKEQKETKSKSEIPPLNMKSVKKVARPAMAPVVAPKADKEEKQEEVVEEVSPRLQKAWDARALHQGLPESQSSSAGNSRNNANSKGPTGTEISRDISTKGRDPSREISTKGRDPSREILSRDLSIKGAVREKSVHFERKRTTSQVS